MGKIFIYAALILIKLNQIGSVSETLEAIKMAHAAGYPQMKAFHIKK